MSTTTRDALPGRFWHKVTIPENTAGCWEWTGTGNGKGYGQFWWGGRMRLAHRISYEALVSPIPDGMVIDHRCRTRGCVNPAHLEPVTNRENVLRGDLPSASAARQMSKTHCPKGHPYNAENTQHRADGARACRQCNRDRVKARYWAKKAVAGTPNTTPAVDAAHTNEASR